jgi:hypothetical protein
MHSFRYLLLSLAVLFLLNVQPSAAQVKDTVPVKDADSAKEKAHFIIGATYNSGMNYYGRADSLKSKGIYPFIGFSLKNGLYLNATFVFIRNNLGSQYAASLVEGGYNFKNQQNNWAGSISASRYFYRDNTDLVQSAVKEVLAASITNLNKVINITIGANAKFSDRTDIGAQAGMDHTIRFPHILSGSDVIVVDPSAYLYAGTQNFTRTYYQQKNLLIFPVAQEQVTAKSSEFNILAYEFSMPIVYGYKKLNLILSPAYVLPQHILSVPGHPELSESGSNLFYVTATVKFTL